MSLHDIADADILSLVEAHVVVLVLVSLLPRLFVSVKVDALNLWQLLVRRVRVNVSDLRQPFHVAVSLLL